MSDWEAKQGADYIDPATTGYSSKRLKKLFGVNLNHLDEESEILENLNKTPVSINHKLFLFCLKFTSLKLTHPSESESESDDEYDLSNQSFQGQQNVFDFFKKRRLKNRLKFINPFKEFSKALNVYISSRKAKLSNRIGSDNNNSSNFHCETRGGSATSGRISSYNAENPPQIATSFIRLLFFLIVIYLIMKFLAISIFQYQLDFRLQLRTEVLRQKIFFYNRTERCILKEDLIRSLSVVNKNEFEVTDSKHHKQYTIEDEQRLEQLRNWLELLGNPMPSISGACEFSIAILTSVPIIFFFGGIFNSLLYDLKADQLCFNYDPIAERFRIRVKLSALISGVIKSSRTYIENYKYRLMNSRHKSFYNGQINFQDIKNKKFFLLKDLLDTIESNNNDFVYVNETIDHDYYKHSESKKPSNHDNQRSNSKEMNFREVSKIITNTTDIPTASSSSFCFMKEQPRILNSYRDFTKNLPNIQVLLDAYPRVKPANLTSSWHLDQAKISNFFLLFGLINGFGMCCVAYCLLIIAEIYMRAVERLRTIECFMWQKGGVPIITSIRLTELNQQNSNEDLKAYLEYDNTIFGLLKLALSVESKYYFSFTNILTSLEIISNFWFCSVLFAFYFNIFAQSYYQVNTWLDQIKEQVDFCVNLMSKYKFVTDEYGFNEERHVQIFRIITITYLNLELFRGQQARHSRQTNLVLELFAMLISETLLLSYIAGTTIATSYRLILLLISTYIVLFFDVFLLLGALRTSKVEKIMTSITQLLAAGSLNDMQDAHICDLWRRQLLSYSDARKLYAPSIFGWIVAYGELISINAYLGALWLVLVKEMI